VLFPKGLAVSLPVRELRDVTLQSSVFHANALANAALSMELAAAIDLVAKFCALLGRKLLFIYRPEIFTHGETLAWLKEQIGDINDHLSISDGSAIKLVPGLRNHMFLYAPGKETHLTDFRRLVERAPEIMPQLGYQINSAFSLKNGGQTHRPASLLLQAHVQCAQVGGELRKFFLNPGALDRASVAKSLNAAATAPARLDRFKSLTYVPFNESAAADQAFCRMVARLIARSVGDQNAGLLVLGCANAMSEADHFGDRVTRLLVGIQKSGILLPRAILSHVLVSAGHIEPALIESIAGPRTIVLHDTFEYWLLPPAYFAAFEQVRLVIPQARRRDRAAMAALVADAANRIPEIVWTANEPLATLDSRRAYA
jgi:hypothetical protein